MNELLRQEVGFLTTRLGAIVREQSGPEVFAAIEILRKIAKHNCITHIYLSTVWLIANVREDDAPFVRVGDAVNVRLHAFPGRIFKARISYVAPMIDPNTHRLQVRADVDNSDRSLKPQMFASFSIVTGRDETGPAIPQRAIIYEGDAARVWIQNKDGQLGLRQLRLGRTDGDTVEALAGVHVGEKIVIGGAIFIDRAATSGSE